MNDDPHALRSTPERAGLAEPVRATVAATLSAAVMLGVLACSQSLGDVASLAQRSQAAPGQTKASLSADRDRDHDASAVGDGDRGERRRHDVLIRSLGQARPGGDHRAGFGRHLSRRPAVPTRASTA